MKFLVAILAGGAVLVSLALGAVALEQDDSTESGDLETSTPGATVSPTNPPQPTATSSPTTGPEAQPTATPGHPGDDHDEGGENTDWFREQIAYNLRSLNAWVHIAMGEGDPYCDTDGPDCSFHADPPTNIETVLGRCDKRSADGMRDDPAYDADQHETLLAGLEHACEQLAEAERRLGPADHSEDWLAVMREVIDSVEDTLATLG